MDNPLLVPPAHDGRPAYDRIRPEHAQPAVASVLADNRLRLQSLLADMARGASPSWERLVEPLDEMAERLARAWGPVTHLFGVNSTPEWRAAYGACLPLVTDYQLELSQNEALFSAYRALAESPAGGALSSTKKKVLHDALRDFKLSGVGLDAERRARFRAVALRLSELQAKFQENVLDSVQNWSKHVTDAGALAGMTEQGLAAAREKAAAKGLEGFRLTLDFPSYDAVVTYADDRALRRELYEAYATRASDQGPLAGRFDNGPIMSEILALRHEQAQILGFRNFSEVSLATKMAESPAEVERFLLDLSARARPPARRELAELAAFARARDGIADIEAWDLPYYAEKLRAERLGFSAEELRPFFQAPEVVRGMFSLAERLYGVRIEQVTGIATWHPDVTTYVVRDAADGATVGFFYLDPYAREDKRGGAWMDECVGRRRTQSVDQRPIAYLTCNFAPPLPGSPALLTHDEVRTLFHEFGHGLQHMLTTVDEPAVSGIRGIEWDAVELPSQFMENWCFDGPTLSGFARHWQSGDPLPAAMLDRLRASRTFHAALATVRQLEFALFDLRLHQGGSVAATGPARPTGPTDASEHAGVETNSTCEADGAPAAQTMHDADAADVTTRARPEPSSTGAAGMADLLAILQAVRSEVSALTPPVWNRMPWSFLHIFAGGYAAGYYSYKWAEVLSADAFGAFEEERFSPAVGRRFRDTVLAQGGSREAMAVFVDFRGRKPSITPLL
ncbi:MAG: M3 family metallopeptidase, partial [Polyangiaceae bacterium]|nr:M3 family metallopeptidase [Polyangiaceae bacterium]